MVAASIILATLFIAYVCWWIVRYNGPLRQLPGVRPVWPMMGNIFQVGKEEAQGHRDRQCADRVGIYIYMYVCMYVCVWMHFIDLVF